MSFYGSERRKSRTSKPTNQEEIFIKGDCHGEEIIPYTEWKDLPAEVRMKILQKIGRTLDTQVARSQKEFIKIVYTKVPLSKAQDAIAETIKRFGQGAYKMIDSGYDRGRQFEVRSRELISCEIEYNPQPLTSVKEQHEALQKIDKDEQKLYTQQEGQKLWEDSTEWTRRKSFVEGERSSVSYDQPEEIRRWTGKVEDKHKRRVQLEQDEEYAATQEEDDKGLSWDKVSGGWDKEPSRNKEPSRDEDLSWGKEPNSDEEPDLGVYDRFMDELHKEMHAYDEQMESVEPVEPVDRSAYYDDDEASKEFEYYANLFETKFKRRPKSDEPQQEEEQQVVEPVPSRSRWQEENRDASRSFFNLPVRERAKVFTGERRQQTSRHDGYNDDDEDVFNDSTYKGNDEEASLSETSPEESFQMNNDDIRHESESEESSHEHAISNNEQYYMFNEPYKCRTIDEMRSAYRERISSICPIYPPPMAPMMMTSFGPSYDEYVPSYLPPVGPEFERRNSIPCLALYTGRNLKKSSERFRKVVKHKRASFFDR